MNTIITAIYDLLKQNTNMIDFEKAVVDYMYQLICESVGEVFEQVNKIVVEEKKENGWKAERKDSRTIQCLFGPVTFSRTFMYDPESNPQYPLDHFLGLRKRQRNSPYVEVKVAELASEHTYRQTAKVLTEWTPVSLSHQTVKAIVEKVGETQSRQDEKLITELEEAAELPKGKEIPFLMAEADGVLVRGLKKRQQVEVRHCIFYEGWKANGTRVSLEAPYTIMSTESSQSFWKNVQAQAAHRYTLTNTRVITNSDGGAGYTAEHFQEAFSQSSYPVLNQLDSFHVSQAITRTLRIETDWKQKVQKAVKEKNKDQLILYLDTIESQLVEEKDIERLQGLRTYLLNQWDRIFDWREQVPEVPEGARGLGSMESHQRRISFRMKKRGMHWSVKGAEAMVKVKQGMINGTLKDAYLQHNQITARAQRKRKKTIRLARLFSRPTRESVGVKQGSFALHAAHSSPLGKLQKGLR